MADPRFYNRSNPQSLEFLCDKAGASCPDAAKSVVISDIANLSDATPSTISFLDNPKYKDDLTKTKATAVFVHPKFADLVPSDTFALVTKQPYHAYAITAGLFYQSFKDEAFIHPTAVIHPTAKLGKNCRVGAHSVIEANVEIGDNADVGATCVISHAIIGNNFHTLSGAKIGQDGFGFALGLNGHLPVPQLGRVIIGNNVTIGSNSCIDRGSGPDTVIGDGTVIDNLVQIGHNVKIGKNCVIAAQTGVSGSTVLQDFVILGGQVGIAGHLNIGAGARIAAQSGVTKNLDGQMDYAGFPAEPAKQYWRMVAGLRNLLSKGPSKVNQVS